MIDTIEQIGQGSVIQHGKLNDRIYLMKLEPFDESQIVNLLAELAAKHQYSKIFCKIPKRTAPLFLTESYNIEGYVPGFYKQKEDALFVSRFLNDDRRIDIQKQNIQQLTQLLRTPLEPKSFTENDTKYSIRRLYKADAEAMAKIYIEVFESYPFPIFEPSYLMQTMDEHIQYFGAFQDGCLAALASSEIDFKEQNAEMTDFATHRLHTGHNLSILLLNFMEQSMRKQGITTLYTIARLNSIPMNKTFIRLGYEYSGTLINNTQIAGRIESMNVYYKQIRSGIIG